MPENPPLTRSEASTGTELADRPLIPLAGNYADDDPLAIDQYFEAADQSPERFDGLRVPQEEIPSLSRIVGRNFNFVGFAGSAPTTAVQVLAPDVRRKHAYLNLYASSDAPSLYLDNERFSYDPLTSRLSAGRYYVPSLSNRGCIFLQPNVSFTTPIEDHTGPLFILPVGMLEPDGNGAFFVSVITVTY